MPTAKEIKVPLTMRMIGEVQVLLEIAYIWKENSYGEMKAYDLRLIARLERIEDYLIRRHQR